MTTKEKELKGMGDTAVLMKKYLNYQKGFERGFQKGKLEQKKEIVKLFYYEIHNNFVGFETLKKLVELNEQLQKEISSEEGKGE